jgi:hypothetical protein
MEMSVLVPGIYEITGQILVFRIGLDNFVAIDGFEYHAAGNETIFHSHIDMISP